MIIILLLGPNALAYDQRFAIRVYQDLINFEINLSGGYKIYWLYPGDQGQATTIDFTNSQNLQSAQILWPFPSQEKSFKDSISYYYTGNLLVPVYLSPIDKNLPILLEANLSYVLCKDQCIPVVQKIKKTLIVKNSSNLNLKAFEISNVVYDSGHLEFIATFSHELGIEAISFLINTGPENFVSHTEVTNISNYETYVNITIEAKKYEDIKGKTFDIYSNKADTPTKLKIPEWNPKNNLINLISMLLLALLGGFLLNFMPCVLPVLSLKLLSIIKTEKNKNISFSLSAIGIIVSFLILAIISILLKNSGKQFGLGVNFQHPEFIIFLSIAIVIFISSAIDKLSLSLPYKLNNVVAHYHFKNSNLESFFNGIIATILSTPCTAPFLGTAMTFAVGESSNLVILLIFLTAGIGFSTPYLLLIILPGLLSYLPKAGSWMLIAKKILASLLVMTLLWLLSILYSQIGLRPVVGLTLLLILLKFFIENVEGMWGKPYIKIAAVTIIIIGSLYLPQVAYKEDLQQRIKFDGVWQKFDKDKIAQYVAEGKIVIVDITADWCVTCKFNKFVVWESARAINLLRQKNIIAMRGDITNFEPNIYNYMASNHVYGVPFNKIYGPSAPQGVMLPPLLSYEDLRQALKKVSA